VSRQVLIRQDSNSISAGNRYQIEYRKGILRDTASTASEATEDDALRALLAVSDATMMHHQIKGDELDAVLV
jgi:hypothetical protein